MPADVAGALLPGLKKCSFDGAASVLTFLPLPKTIHPVSSSTRHPRGRRPGEAQEGRAGELFNPRCPPVAHRTKGDGRVRGTALTRGRRRR
ncbi:hypothetical protein OAO87_00200 [bacterium]|nr:hypothetical protein [bacterium]